MTVSNYTEQEDAQILASRLVGIPWAQVALDMGRTSEALQGRYKQIRARAALGRPHAPIRDPDTDQFPERTRRHLEALLTASPRGFPALSERSLGRGLWAVNFPLIWPMRRLTS